jgi:hypothetical protein
VVFGGSSLEKVLQGLKELLPLGEVWSFHEVLPLATVEKV